MVQGSAETQKTSGGKEIQARFLLWSAYLHKTKNVLWQNSVGLFVFKMWYMVLIFKLNIKIWLPVQ